MVGNHGSIVGAGWPLRFALRSVGSPLVPVAAVVTAVANLFTRGFCSGYPPIGAHWWACVAR